MGLGHVERDKRLKPEELVIPEESEDILSMVSQDWKDDVEELIRICKENDKKLTLFLIPITEGLFSEGKSHKEFSSFVSEMAGEEGVRFIDFNYIPMGKNQLDIEDYADAHHLNKWGADKFSEVLAEYMEREN